MKFHPFLYIDTIFYIQSFLDGEKNKKIIFYIRFLNSFNPPESYIFFKRVFFRKSKKLLELRSVKMLLILQQWRNYAIFSSVGHFGQLQKFAQKFAQKNLDFLFLGDQTPIGITRKRQPAAQLLVGSLYKNGKKLVLVERNLEGRYITIGLRMSTKTGFVLGTREPKTLFFPPPQQIPYSITIDNRRAQDNCKGIKQRRHAPNSVARLDLSQSACWFCYNSNCMNTLLKSGIIP